MPKACNSIKKETPVQVLSHESREIPKNTPSDRTPPVAASELKYTNNDLIKKIHET